MKETKRTIAVIFGGCSPEYGVSLESAYAVIKNMDQEHYRPVPVGISRTGSWFYFTGSTEKIKADTWYNEEDCIPALLSPNRGAKGCCFYKESLPFFLLTPFFRCYMAKTVRMVRCKG